jgi:hypothetical protein
MGQDFNAGELSAGIERDNANDFALRFWALVLPACLLFWLGVGYAIYMAVRGP